MNEDAQLSAVEQDGLAIVRISGRATAKISDALAKYAATLDKKEAKALVLDLRHCETMDSTFMGTIAGIGLNFRGRIPLLVVHASNHVRRLLKGIGVDRMLEFVDAEALAEPTAPERQITAETSRQDMARTVLKAHKTLVQIDAGNEEKFRDVIEILEQEMSEQDGESRE